MEDILKISERERIGQRIVELRKERGLSQKELAEMVGITPGNLSRIEAGKYDTKLESLARIAEPMGCQVDFVEITAPQ